MKLLLLLSVLSLSGCSAFNGGDSFGVTARPPSLMLDNRGDRAVYYLAMEADFAARVDLSPNVEGWPSLAAGQTLSIPYGQLDGYEAGDTEAVVYWSEGRKSGQKQERVRL